MGALLLYVHIPQTEVNIPAIQGMLTYHLYHIAPEIQIPNIAVLIDRDLHLFLRFRHDPIKFFLIKIHKKIPPCLYIQIYSDKKDSMHHPLVF